MRCLVLAGLFIVSLAAAEPTAADIAASLIRVRAQTVASDDAVLAAALQQLADGVAHGRITLAEARDVLAIQAALPGAVPSGEPAPRAARVAAAPAAPAAPVTPAAPAVAADQVMSVLDGPAPTATTETPVQPSGEVLAIEAGADGNPALVAVSIGALHGIREGQRLAITRAGATLVLARASQVRDDLTIALLIPTTWTGDDREIRVGDTAAVLPTP